MGTVDPPVPDSTPCRPRSCSWKHLYSEVVTSGLCTGCAGCVIACPHDVLGYRDDRGRLQAVPARGGLGPGQLQPRREGLHVVHPGVSPVPGVGARDRRVHVRPGPHRRRAVGHLQGHRPRPRHRPGARRGRPGRRPRLRAPRLRARARHDRRRAGELPRGRRHVVEGDPGRGTHTRRRHRVGREPLHVLAPTPWPTPTRSRAAPSASPSSA